LNSYGEKPLNSHVKKGARKGDIINQSYDSGGNELNAGSFEYDVEADDSQLRD
jgi:hypothetical protein